MSSLSSAGKRRSGGWAVVRVLVAGAAVAFVAARAADQGAGGRRRRAVSVMPGRPQWLCRPDGRPLFICGPGDPEDFLYRGKLNPDGTRSGDQLALIRKLAGTGANSIYIMAVRSHGGDGDSTHNPFVDHDPAKGLNQAVLNQWEGWLRELDRAGIVTFFFLYDDSARVWATGDRVCEAERAFVRGLVDRFEGIGNLVWCVAEEYQEALTARRASLLAAEIRAADDYDHPIAVHKLPGLSFEEFADDPCVDVFAMQLERGAAGALHRWCVKAWRLAAGRYNVTMAEAPDFGVGQRARRKMWACAMAGAYVMVLDMDIASTPPSDLEDCGRLVRFFERTEFYEMAPHDELAWKDTEYVLACPGDSYIAYTSRGRGLVGLRGLRPGTYRMRWMDCATGKEVVWRGIRVKSGEAAWSKPKGLGREIVVYVRRTGG